MAACPLWFVLLLVALLAVVTLQSYHGPVAFAAAVVLMLGLVYACCLFPSLYPRGLNLFFFKLFLIFIQCAAALGLYEYGSYLVNGPSTGMLISYLLPPNQSFRIAGIYGQSNLFALLLLVGMLVWVYVSLHGYLRGVKVSKFLSPLRHLPFFTVALVFFLTGSRSGFLAFAATSLYLMLLLTRKQYLSGDRDRRRKLVKIMVVVVFAFATAHLCNTYLQGLHAGGGVAGRGVAGLADTGSNIDARVLFWTASVLIFLDHPLLGIGLDNFQFLLPKYVVAAHDLLGFVPFESMVYATWAHNEVLQVLCEGGLALTLPLLLLLGCYLYRLFSFTRCSEKISPRFLYSHLFLLPFVIVAMFTWPLRHAALLILFFTFAGSLLAQYPGRRYELSVFRRTVLRLAGIGILVVVIWIGQLEIRMGAFTKGLELTSPQRDFATFQTLVANPYAEHPLLLSTTRFFITALQRESNSDFAVATLPYFERLVNLQGAHWQWFNLAQTYHIAGRENEARRAVTQALELQPSSPSYWDFQHALNMQKAARETGRPLSDFIPRAPSGGSEFKLPAYMDPSHGKN